MKSRVGSPSPEPKKKTRKHRKSIEREDVAILHQKTPRPAVVTHSLQRVEKAKMRNWQKLKGFMWWIRRTLTNVTSLLS